MKFNYVAMAVVTIFVIAWTLPANAETDRPYRPDSHLKDIKNRILDQRADFQEKREDGREDRRGVFEGKVEDKIENRMNRRASTTGAFHDRMEEKKERLHDRLASTTDKFRKKLDGRQKEDVKENLDKIFERFDAAINRLVGLSERIQSRIDKFKEEGSDIGDAQDKLNKANDLIDNATASLRAVKSALDEAFESDSEISKNGIRELITEAKEAIKSAHAGLVEAVRVLKNSHKSDGDGSGDE